MNTSREELLFALAPTNVLLLPARRQSASRRRAEAALLRAAKVEGLEHSKTWRTSHRPR